MGDLNKNNLNLCKNHIKRPYIFRFLNSVTRFFFFFPSRIGLPMYSKSFLTFYNILSFSSFFMCVPSTCLPFYTYLSLHLPHLLSDVLSLHKWIIFYPIRSSFLIFMMNRDFWGIIALFRLVIYD